MGGRRRSTSVRASRTSLCRQWDAERSEAKAVEEDLIAENQRLRMEIDYLKKLNALVLEEERQNRKHK